MINGYGFFQLSMCGNGNMLQWYRLQTLIEGAIRETHWSYKSEAYKWKIIFAED